MCNKSILFKHEFFIIILTNLLNTVILYLHDFRADADKWTKRKRSKIV